MADVSQKEMCVRGRLVAHTSEEDSGCPDVGMSLGLGDNTIIYVGELYGTTRSIVIYQGDRETIVSSEIDFDNAKDLLELLAGVLKHA